MKCSPATTNLEIFDNLDSQEGNQFLEEVFIET